MGFTTSYCILGLDRLLPHIGRNIRKVALVGENGRKIFLLTDQIQGSQGFPHLLGGGIDHGDFRSCGNELSKEAYKANLLLSINCIASGLGATG